MPSVAPIAIAPIPFSAPAVPSGSFGDYFTGASSVSSIAYMSPGAISLGFNERMKNVVENIGVENLKEGSATKQMYEAFTKWEEGMELARSGKGWESITKLFCAIIIDQRACNHVCDISSPNKPDYSVSTNLVDKSIENAEKEVDKTRFSKEQMDWYQHVYSIIVFTLKAHYMQLLGPFVPSVKNVDQAAHLTLAAQERWKKESVPSFTPNISALLDSGKIILEDRVILALLTLGSQIQLCSASGMDKLNEPGIRDSHITKSTEIAQISVRYEANYIPGLMQLATNYWRKCDNMKKRQKAVKLFKKISEIAPLDDKVNAEARYMYALGVCVGYSNLPGPITAGKVRELFDWARLAERESKPLFEKATCEGRTRMKEVIKQIKKRRSECDDIVKLEFKAYSREKQFNAKLSIAGRPVKLAKKTADQFVNDVYRPVCFGCNVRHQDVLVCSRCKKTWYCSTACQTSHWKAGHKANCIPDKKSTKVGRSLRGRTMQKCCGKLQERIEYR